MEDIRVCIVGAGSSGIPAIKAMVEAGFSVDCFEMGSRVGGNWVFGNDNGISNIYRSLHINTSRTRMAYGDYAMPDHYPDYPGHEEIAAYFDDYVDHFDLRRHIHFQTTVGHCELRSDGVWEVTTLHGDDTTVREYDVLLVANGHHWDARWPEPPYPGNFNGLQFHSHDYVSPSEPHDLSDKNILVLGMGNSAMDIATELGQRSNRNRVYLSSRRGAWILPKYLFGEPLDLLPVKTPIMHPAIPYALRRPLLNTFMRFAVGKMSQYGLPDPAHDPDAAHPSVSGELPLRAGSGDVDYVGEIERLDGDYVVFKDGSKKKVDVIIWCTGYNVSFPFFDSDFISAPENDLPLFRRVFKPGIPNLAFIGLLQPLGAIMPLAEAQSKWVADYLTGKYAMPSEEQMIDDMDRERSAMFKRYVASRRHTMQVDFEDYLWNLRIERTKGRLRAIARGQKPPLAARATTGAREAAE